MRLASVFAISTTLFLAAAIPGLAMPRSHRGPTSPKTFTKRTTAKPTTKPVSQRAIDPERSTQIQTALIKSGYLSGAPTGVWDAQTEGAMQKLQADNGWQTKIVPDSRAIIKLGLGPNAEVSASPSKPALSDQ